MKNTFGTALTLTLYGESHGPVVGAVLDGLPPGFAVDEAYIAAEMEKRRGGPGATQRAEPDEVQLLSGVYRGHTTGEPLCLQIANTNARSEDYAQSHLVPRPGHADVTARARSLGWHDPRGGGHFSGRLTAPLVAAGALCRAMLASRGVCLGTHLARCAGVNDAPLPEGEAELTQALQGLNQKHFAVLDEAAGQAMRQAIEAAAAAQNSVGGILETAVTGLPAGLGEPFFASAESVLAGLFFSIPGVKGVEFGSGFALADLRGSQAADGWAPSANGAPQTLSNHNGGINGGVTNGMPLVLRAVVKPTPSVGQPLPSVNLATGQATTLSTAGRHDACILPRARAVCNAVTALGLADLFAQRFGRLWAAGKEKPLP